MKFEVGQIWKDRDGFKWIILDVLQDSMFCYCPLRSGDGSWRSIEAEGRHPKNDGCDFIAMVDNVPGLEGKLRDANTAKKNGGTKDGIKPLRLVRSNPN